VPDPLVWLMFPLGATLAAMGWTAWSGRARGPQQPADSIAAHERFRRAMAAPLSAPPGQQRDRS
jgi:hypothetical protein